MALTNKIKDKILKSPWMSVTSLDTVELFCIHKEIHTAYRMDGEAVRPNPTVPNRYVYKLFAIQPMDAINIHAPDITLEIKTENEN
jgi:hypothetical protein